MTDVVVQKQKKPRCLNPDDDGSCNRNPCFCPCDCDDYEFAFKQDDLRELETSRRSKETNEIRNKIDLVNERLYKNHTSASQKLQCYCPCKCHQTNGRPGGENSANGPER
jgi:hypothetical protein